MDNTYAPAYNDRGVCYQAQAKYDSAIDDYRKALRLDRELYIASDNISNAKRAKEKAKITKEENDPNIAAAKRILLKAFNSIKKTKEYRRLELQIADQENYVEQLLEKAVVADKRNKSA